MPKNDNMFLDCKCKIVIFLLQFLNLEKEFRFSMDELNEIISNNIATLRKRAGITQAQLAQKLNYSDKAVSKWERGESVPDVAVLKSIANFFNVSLDALVTRQAPNKIRLTKHISLSKSIIIALSVIVVFLIATITFVGLAMGGVKRAWLAFVIAAPIAALVAFILNSAWGRRIVSFFFLSVFIWSTLAALYLCIADYGAWLLFLIGIPLQIAVVLWFFLIKTTQKARISD